MAFEYKRRSSEDVSKRADQQGSDYQGFIKDEYKTFTAKKGDNWIRILPPSWKDARHYGYDVHAHYGVGPENAHIICNLKQFNTPCPVCEARAGLERKGDEEGAKALRVSRRVCVWVLDQKDPEKNPELWPMPWSLDRDIAKLSTDKRTGDTYYIDDPDEGYDVTFEREGEKITTKYTGLQLSRRPSSIPDRALDWIEDHPIPDTILRRTYDEVLDIFTGGMGLEARSESKRPGRQDDDAQRPRNRNPESDTRETRRGRDEDRDDDRKEDPRSERGRDDRDEPRTRKRIDREDPPADTETRRSRDEERPAGRDRGERPAEEPKRERRRIERDERDEPRRDTRSETEKDLDDDVPFDGRREEPPPEKDRTRRAPDDRPASDDGKDRASSLRDRVNARRNGG